MTPTQKRNLKKLADYLATGQTEKKFSMAVFCANDTGDDFVPSKAECGTVACALGHGPAAGVKPRRETWRGYAERAFGLFIGTGEWRWCFSDDWVKTDNTPEGASARIDWLLKRGLPADHADQRTGFAPPCYLPTNVA